MRTACSFVLASTFALFASGCGTGTSTMQDMVMHDMVPKMLDCTANAARFSDIKGTTIKQTCIISDSCHTAAGKMGSLDLATDPYKALVDVAAANPAAKTEGLKRVVPNDEAHSFLVVKLRLPMGSNLQNNKYGQLMPNGQMLDPNVIEDIRCWIQHGAKND